MAWHSGFGPTTERDSVCKIQEPSVAESISAGADLTLFSGDKLLGGPQCGIILGKRDWIEPLRKSALMRAMRLDKLTLAASAEATLEIHLEGKAKDELPIIQMLSEESQAIEDRCKCLEQELAQIGGDRMDVIPQNHKLGWLRPRDECLELWPIDSHAETTEVCHKIASAEFSHPSESHEGCCAP